MIYNAPTKDMLFLINEWIGIDRLTTLPGFEDVDADLIEAVLEEAGKFASSELLTINRDGDEHGAVYNDGEVTTPPGFKEAYKNFIEAGWTSIDASPDHGGQGLPKLLQSLIDEILGATNVAFKLYTELSRGAYHCMAHSASEDICDRYLPKVVEGVWSGTMCLTEPHCGTDLGLLKTKATPAADGTYRLSGEKIFITSGDHDLTENILHLVIARIDGAPAGTRGISLFLVPKFLVNDDGSLGERNGVQTASIEHKMGIKASATCSLVFNDATGYLLGEENRGLANMFKMMNLERITVGLQGLGLSDIALQNALDYAQERRQSKAPAPRPDDGAAADPIVYQPEMKRQLLTIRSQVEGARALSVFAGLNVDIMERSPDKEAAATAEATVALLTPVIKAHFSDLGMSATLSAQQIYGGHGYVREHGMEQLVRDCRIAPIYEGTNEVQALDLVSRKVTGKMQEFANAFLGGWLEYLDASTAGDDGEIAAAARESLQRLIEVTQWVQARAGAGEDAAMRGSATQYLRLFALTIIGCLWAQVIDAIADKQGEFYDVKRKLARFYVQQVLPETAFLAGVIVNGSEALADFDVADFGA
ncbi:MAG: acyl-CoA dehydrogenase C-terminal domain-containing protein [Woeseiaceae bacterium]|nr:acyl-CoA dehydrogenase C-terminal domain-containing protein [Woeseiaceae bacterium]